MNPLHEARLEYQAALKRAKIPEDTRRYLNDRIAQRLSSRQKRQAR
jgi:hypothetical protein